MYPEAKRPRVNAGAEAATVVAWYSIFAVPFVVGVYIWQAGGIDQFTSKVDVAGFSGTMAGNVVVLAVLMSAYLFWRNRAKVTKNFGSDYRFWVLAVVSTAFPSKPFIGMIWCGCIYQFRENRREEQFNERLKVASASEVSSLVGGNEPVE